MECIDLQDLNWLPGDEYNIALFYRYVFIDNVEDLIVQLRNCCTDNGILGRILVSHEGINGTLAGGVASVARFVRFLSSDSRFDRIDWKFTLDKGDQLPFLGLSIREVEEIISSGPAKTFIADNIKFENDSYGGIVGTGTHLTPAEFHSAIARGDGVILDVRNEFEYDIGHFEGSTNLKTFNYAETFDALDKIVGVAPAVPESINHSDNSTSNSVQTEHEPDHKNIYMYCTGGIRCEKASAYLCAKGFTNVYQLEGGIHRYLERFPDGGLFQGKNFVFDSRVSVGPTSTATTNRLSEQDETGCEGEDQRRANPPGTNSCSSAGSSSVGGCAASTVVGRCIDCSAPHDVYSGFIVCTVCRMPVLVCPTCVQNNSAPGEYHCSRHRDLKELYFTVLTQFFLTQLQAQLAGLQALLATSITRKAALLKEEKARRRMAASRAHRCIAVQDPCSTSQAALLPTSEKDEKDTSVEVETESARDEGRAPAGSVGTAPSGTAEHMGKQRRRTIRKQVERLEKLIRTISTAQNADQGEISVENTQADLVDETVDISCNPKTRGGWGFWKT